MKPKQTLELITLLLIATWIIVLPFEKQHIFDSIPYFPNISLYLSDILGLILLSFLIVSTRNNSLGLLISPYSKVFWAIALVFSISWLISPRETVNSYIYIKWLFALTLTTFLISTLSLKRVKQVLLNSMIFSGLVQAIIAIGQFFTQKSLGLKLLGEPNISAFINGVAKIDLVGEKAIRAYGTFAHPNQLAAFLFVACATCIWLYIQNQDQKHKYIYAISLIVLLIGEITTFSRSGTVVTYIFLSLILLMLLYLKNKNFKPLLLIITVVTIFAGIIFNPYLQSRAKQQAPETYTRTLYNNEGLKLFNEHPLTGVGIGESRKEISERVPHTEEWQIQVPHNFFIIVSSETGLLGLIAFLSLFIYLIKGLWRKIKEGGGEYTYILLFTLIGIILLMQFDHYFYTLQQTQLLFFLLIAMIIAEISPKRSNV